MYDDGMTLRDLLLDSPLFDRFVDDRRDVTARSSLIEIQREWSKFAEQAGDPLMHAPMKSIAAALKEKGFMRHRTARRSQWWGIRA
jgi:hypothetical protein